MEQHLRGMETIPGEWESFIEAVNDAYHRLDMERKMLEHSLELSSQELLEANSEMRALFHALPDVFLRIDRCGIIIDYKAPTTDNLPFSLERVIGAHIFDLFPRETHKTLSDALTQTQKSRSLVSVEFSLTKEKSEYFFEVRMVPLLETEVVVILRDITDRKRVEDSLKSSEEMYRILMENAPIGIYYSDFFGTFLYCNKKAEDIFGYRREELIGKNFLAMELLEPADVKRVARLLEINRLERGTGPDEFTLYRKDGSRMLVEISTEIITVKRERVVLGMIQDLTGRKRAEEDLRLERDRFETLVNKLPMGVVLIGRDGTFKYVNPKFVEMFGYTLEDIPNGRTWFRKAYPNKEYRHLVISTWINDARMAGAKRERPRTFTVTCKDGTEKVIYFVPVRLESGEDLMTCEDITERQKLEAQLIQAQKMEAIGTLAGGIAHDFNNLLMSIQGYTSLMLLNTDPNHPNYERLKSIEKQVKSGADLTKQLLGFARSGKYEVKPTDMNEIVKMSAAMFGRTKKEITIHEKYQKDLWRTEVDQGQIEQVLLNLYVNAWQAMPAGGDLYLQTQNVVLDEEYVEPYKVKPGRYVKISVTDTGIGMDEKTRKRVFEPFFTTKEMGRGTGLGLASAYGIIKNHGGIIEVSSMKGYGTTFDIYLPATDKEIRTTSSPAPRLLKGHGTILLVDDEEMIIEVTRDMLQELGYRVIVARSGAEALEMYKTHAHEIDLVILDMIMPGMGGGETFDNLKAINPEISVILSSGYSFRGTAADIMKRGCRAFIQKPFDMEVLSRKIREVLGASKDTSY